MLDEGRTASCRPPLSWAAVTGIPAQYAAAVADAAALVVLAAFLTALVAHCVCETRRMTAS